MEDDDDLIIAAESHDELKEASNIASSSSSSFSCSTAPYYDEIITKLQLQSMAEHEYGIPQHQHQQQQKSQEEQKEETGNQKRNKRRRRILLVDDEPDHCLIYQIVLQDAGFECISYTDPVKALQEFRPNFYDLIILDVRMPVLNGFELCKKIIEIDKIVHIIFITALPQYCKDTRDQSYPELRNTLYIQKPVSNEELTKIVNQMLGTRNQY